mgnify:CR=1 FL=1
MLKAKHDAGIPSADIAAQGERLAAKFDALAEPVLGGPRSRELRAAILGLDSLADVRQLGAAGGRLTETEPLILSLNRVHGAARSSRLFQSTAARAGWWVPAFAATADENW